MRLYRWQARRTIGQLADRAGGAALHGLMPWEVTEILSLADDWGDIDGSHRKLAHRGIREQRVWVSPSTVARVLEANGRELSPKPARRRRAAQTRRTRLRRPPTSRAGLRSGITTSCGQANRPAHMRRDYGGDLYHALRRKTKGVVERANGYLETSFLSGRDFSGVDDFNTQLRDWLETRANLRVHSGLRCRPSERIDADLAAMLPQPPVLPDTDWRKHLRLPADHLGRVDTNDYSVHPKAVGRRVEVRVNLDEVVVTCGTETVARHDRVLARHVTVTDPAHDAARRARIELARPPVAEQPSEEVEVEQSDLAAYDRALGAA